MLIKNDGKHKRGVVYHGVQKWKRMSGASFICRAQMILQWHAICISNWDFLIAFNFLSKCRICHIFYKAAQTGVEFLGKAAIFKYGELY